MIAGHLRYPNYMKFNLQTQPALFRGPSRSHFLVNSGGMRVPLIDLKAQYSTIQKEIHPAIEGVLASQKFILDSEGEAFESEIAAYTGTRFAIGCASGTDAILLSLRALNIGEGDEVITTSYSFFSTASTIASLKATPVFVDIDPRTFNLNAAQVKSKITSRTKAILAVHLFGQCCTIEDLLALGIPVIEDAAQAIGAKRNGQKAGSFGVLACFSFFPTKNLGGYGDGGMITTNDESLTGKLRMLRSHGQSKQYYHTILGTNSRLDEIQSAILRAKLVHLDVWNAKRNTNARVYQERLAGIPLQLPVIESGNVSNYHQFVIKTDQRDALKTALAKQDIGTAIYYPVPIPLQPCFSYLGHRSGDFPEAETCAAQSLALPIFPELTAEQLDTVAGAIRTFFNV
jgi:dTDP-4-amino-4,6-dideoxygalactose transaminase